MIDPGSEINCARTMVAQGKRTNGKCLWRRRRPEACRNPIGPSGWFCAEHEAEIAASTDPYVHNAWNLLVSRADDPDRPPSVQPPYGTVHGDRGFPKG